MEKAKVSIIIPLYNNEKYIEKCILSVINQNYKNIEIIVINDGSTDSSNKIVKNLQMKNRNIKLINQKNEGPSSARNNGIKAATGEWIIFLDSDDILDETCISTLINKSHSTDWVIAGWSAIYKNKTKYFGPILNEKLEKQELEKLGSYLLSCRAKKYEQKINVGSIEGPVAKLYSTNIINNNNIFFPENLRYAEDVCFNYKYLQHCKSIVTLNKTVYYASRHRDSLSNSQKSLLKLREKFNSEITKNNINNWNIEKNVIYRYIYWALDDLEKSSLTNYREFKKAYKKANEIDLKDLEKKYLSKFKKIELKFLNFKEPISFILFNIYNAFKRICKRLKYEK